MIESGLAGCLSRLLYFLFSSSKLRSYEQICIDAFRTELPEEEKVILDEQMKVLSFIQRQAGGLKTVFYEGALGKNDVSGIVFSNMAESHVVCAGMLVGKISDSTIEVGFRIYTHRGRLFSIEYSSFPNVLSRADSLRVSLTGKKPKHGMQSP